MRAWLIILVVALGACNTPGPAFRNAEAFRISEGQDRFQIRRNGSLVQVLRVNPRAFPAFREVAQNAELAVRGHTGCKVVWLIGDVAMLTAGLKCPGEKAPRIPKVRRGSFFVM